MNEWTLFLKKLINVKFWGNDLKKKLKFIEEVARGAQNL